MSSFNVDKTILTLGGTFCQGSWYLSQCRFIGLQCHFGWWFFSHIYIHRFGIVHEYISIHIPISILYLQHFHIHYRYESLTPFYSNCVNLLPLAYSSTSCLYLEEIPSLIAHLPLLYTPPSSHHYLLYFLSLLFSSPFSFSPFFPNSDPLWPNFMF